MTQILFDMKRIIKYGMYTLLALLATMSFQSCNDDKDIVMITDELPLKIDTSIWWGTPHQQDGRSTIPPS